MMSNPDQYIGKVIKANGFYSRFYAEEAKKNIHFLIVADAGSCCELRLEFICSDENAYPKNYEEGSTIIFMTGVFTHYEDQEFTRYLLATDNLLILK